MAPTLAEAVRGAGGWAFDQAMAGWDVTVLTEAGADDRALRILGVSGLELDPVLAAPRRARRPHAVVADAAFFAADPRVRRLVREAADVRFWTPEGGDPDEPILHRLSLAARAFKIHAVTAVGGSDGPEETLETFHRAPGVPVRTQSR